MEDQKAFSSLSGDWNPIHVDPVIARRLISGGVLVHGIHVVLTALEQRFSFALSPASLSSLRIVFHRPVRVGARVVCDSRFQGSTHSEHLLYVDGMLSVKIKARWRVGGDTFENSKVQLPEFQEDQFESPQSLEWGEIETMRGGVPLYLPLDSVRTLFPKLSGHLPLLQMAFLLATTRLVGMICPGLHSVYGKLQLDFSETCEQDIPILSYKVTETDVRFRHVEMEVNGPGVAGRVIAYRRPEIVVQPSLSQVRDQVSPECFDGLRALVIGGSRGLGETAAKILACGGASVWITYCQGQVDAEKLVKELGTEGVDVDCCVCDVLNVISVQDAIKKMRWVPNVLLYFASPFIQTHQGSFSHLLYEEFSRVYVGGLANTVEAIRGVSQESLIIWYPSTVFIDQPQPMLLEYSTAKAAGEALCFQLGNTLDGVRCYVPRLPRLPTDQTAGLVDAVMPDVLEVMMAAMDVLKK
ncbi:MAG: SDR family NAD(P)-dependent oxidoreductase [Nitrospirae bacterium]|nr:SDR family NAD(P)-dependent oxidoreductase [Magnetococcales bacterium]